MSKGLLNLSVSSVGDPVVKSVQSLNSSLEKWKKDVKSGKEILADISDCLKTRIESKNCEKYSLELQDQFDRLDAVCGNLNDRLQNIERVTEKLQGCAELEALQSNKPFAIISHSKLHQASQHILSCYRKQAKLSHEVLKDILKARNENEVTLFTCIWVHQPAIDSECEVYEQMMSYYLESKEPDLE